MCTAEHLVLGEKKKKKEIVCKNLVLQQFICIKGLPEGEYLGLDVRYKMKQIRAVKRLSLIYRSESSGLSVTSCTGTTEVCRIWIAQGARVHACVCVSE